MEKCTYKVIKKKFTYMGINHNIQTSLEIDKYSGFKGEKDGFLEKIKGEIYEDEFMTEKELTNALKSYGTVNPYFNKDLSLFGGDSLIFKNKYFKDDINLKNIKNINVKFINCKFENLLSIESSEFENLIFENSEIKFFDMKKNFKILNIEFNFYNKIKSIHIENEPNIGDISISNYNYIININIWNSVITGKLIIELNNDKSINKTTLHKNHFKDEVKINFSKFDELGISKNIFNKKVFFIGNKFNIYLDIFENVFKERLKISKLDGHPFKMKKYKEEMSKLEKNTGLKPFISDEIEALRFISNKINSFRLGHQKITNLIINDLKNSNESELNIGSLEIIDKFQISNLRNYSQMRLFKINIVNPIKTTNEFKINDSTFGKAEFQEVNFKAFKVVKIYSSNLTNIETIDVIWPEKIFGEEKKNLEQQKNTYRMLKNSMIKQEDKIQALEFHSKEMKTYRKLLFKNPFKNFLNIILLLFSNINNFGLNWIIPLVLILVINISFVSIIIDDSIGNLFYFTLKLSIPFESVDSVLNCCNSTKISIYDILRRILISGLIYETIIAFRKYSRKL